MVKQPRSSKRQIEANRRDKAERKRLRKIERVNDSGVAEGDGTSDAPMDHDAVIAALAQLHQAYADGDVSLEDLEAGRLELTSRLHVD